MSTEIRLPQFGMGMQEGTIVRWFKKAGDSVEAGEVIAEVEASKAISEIIAPASGVIAQVLVAEDQTVPVLEVLAILDPPPDKLG